MPKRLIRSLLIFLGLTALSARPVSAHGGVPHSENLWTHWALDPVVLLLIGGSALLYARGYQSIRRRAGAVPFRRRWQNWAFWIGLFTVFAALVSPLDALADELLTAHMVQHTLLMLVAAPLLVLSLPLPPILLGLPSGWSQQVGRFWQRQRWLGTAWKLITRPGWVWLLFTAVLWLWHAPDLYQAAVLSDGIHALQHASFTGGSLLFWWAAIRTLGAHADRRGAGVMFLFTTALHSGLLGALMTFSSTPWYPVYAERTAAWGLSPLADQQLAGTIMWVPAGLVFLLAALLMMKAWLEGLESGEAAGSEELK